jgi:two-component system response regulator
MKNRDLGVLLVEDNPEDVAFTRIILKNNGLDRNLMVTANAKDTMDVLQNMKKELSKVPDLILLDINLPDVSGLDLLTKIKKDSRFAQIPVVMLTGSNVGDDIQRSYDLGASTYLVKPISKNALVLVIENLFG